MRLWPTSSKPQLQCCRARKRERGRLHGALQLRRTTLSLKHTVTTVAEAHRHTEFRGTWEAFGAHAHKLAHGHTDVLWMFLCRYRTNHWGEPRGGSLTANPSSQNLIYYNLPLYVSSELKLNFLCKQVINLDRTTDNWKPVSLLNKMTQ